MPSPEVFGFIFVSLCVAGAFALRRWYRQGEPSAAREAEFEKAGFKRVPQSWDSRNVEFRGPHGNAIAFQRICPPSRSTGPRELSVGLRCGSPLDFEVTLENSGDRMAKRLGLAKEVQTGDAGFDSTFYLAGSEPKFVATVFASREARASVAALLSRGFDSVVLEDGELSARRHGDHCEFVALEQWLQACDLLAPLRIAVHAANPALAVQSTRDNSLWAILAAIPLAFVLVVALFAISNAHTLLDSYAEIARRILPWCLGSLAATAAALAIILRGRADALRTLGASLALAAFLVPFLTLSGAIFVNERFDDSVAVDHEVRQISKFATTGRGYKHHIVLGTWREDGRNIELHVTERQYADARNDSVWRVTTKPGRLGLEWIVQASPTGP